jgi:hypothetical protein
LIKEKFVGLFVVAVEVIFGKFRQLDELKAKLNYHYLINLIPQPGILKLKLLLL